MMKLDFHNKELYNLNFYDYDSDSDDSDFVCDDDVDDNLDNVKSPIFDAVSVGSIIALYTPTNVDDAYYLRGVNDKCVTKESMSDKNGHTAYNGERIFKCNYLQRKGKSKLSKTGFQFELVDDEVIVNPLQVLSPHVDISDSLFLTMSEHLFLCDCS